MPLRSITWCEELYVLLDNLDMVTANDVDLKPIPSNNTKIMSFNVTCPQVWALNQFVCCFLLVKK